jgi:hypothetical protein
LLLLRNQLKKERRTIRLKGESKAKKLKKK